MNNQILFNMLHHVYIVSTFNLNWVAYLIWNVQNIFQELFINGYGFEKY